MSTLRQTNFCLESNSASLPTRQIGRVHHHHHKRKTQKAFSAMPCHAQNYPTEGVAVHCTAAKTVAVYCVEWMNDETSEGGEHTGESKYYVYHRFVPLFNAVAL